MMMNVIIDHPDPRSIARMEAVPVIPGAEVMVDFIVVHDRIAASDAHCTAGPHVMDFAVSERDELAG